MFKYTKNIYVAFDGKEFDSEKECMEYEKNNKVNITKEMTDELNHELEKLGCIFRFRFETYSTDSSIGVICPEFINEKFLDTINGKCTLSSKGEMFIEGFFKTKGIDSLYCTRAGGYMAHQHDYKTY